MMELIRALSIEAEDPKKGLTLGELTDFVSAAMKADLPRETRLRIDIGWNSQIRKLETR